MKRILNLVDDCDFSLLGLSCHAKDYRLSWEINKALDIDLAKIAAGEESDGALDFEIAMATYFNEETHIEYTLTPNNNNGELLVPEHPQLDYFIKIDGPLHETEAKMCKTILKGIDIILAVIELNPNNLKSKLNLMF